MKLAKSLLLTIALLPVLQGCHVPLQSYRVAKSAIVVPPEPPNPLPTTTVAIASQEKPCLSAETPICLAFIEVDDMGELFDKVEVDNALRVIRQANDLAKTEPGNDPIVITFVHGWKNNAAETNSNVAGFKAALQEVYRRFGKSHHVIGIFVGWRGNLIKDSWPVQQQLSYYNREATATRVPGASLSSALTQIATRTHENEHALAIYIGHSFGGLLLERTLSEATASQIAQTTIFTQEANAAPKGSQEATEKAVAAKLATDARADLVIFINPAGAATEAKQMLDFLTYNGYSYQPTVQNEAAEGRAAVPTSNQSDDRPLFVSLTSTTDLATKVAMPIGHWWPDLQFKGSGSFRTLNQEPNKKYDLACFDPHNQQHAHWELNTKAEGAVDQSSYYMSTAPHMPILQSHLMLKAIGATQMQVSSTGQKITIQDPNAIAQCNRDLFNKQGLDIVSTFRLADTGACFAVQERPNRCNGTPYWLMEIDTDVVPDHSTIFTQRFISFLIDTYFTPKGQPLQRLSPRLMQTSTAAH
ncbi:MAG TPA: alpha/beta hydrolase [Alloacidobacterium sp.]|nr:alpha/beta hydrolase [Alloacidobacterium sp.]